MNHSYGPQYMSHKDLVAIWYISIFFALMVKNKVDSHNVESLAAINNDIQDLRAVDLSGMFAGGGVARDTCTPLSLIF